MMTEVNSYFKEELGELHPLFLKEETGLERVSDLPKVTQLTWHSLFRDPKVLFSVLWLYFPLGSLQGPKGI